MPAYLGDASDDIEPSTVQVQVADPQGSQFTEPQPRVGEHQDGQAPSSSPLRKDCDLVVGKEPLVPGGYSRQPDPSGGVAGDPVVFHRQRQRHGKHPVRLTHGGSREPRIDQACDPPGNLDMATACKATCCQVGRIWTRSRLSYRTAVHQ